MKDPQKIVIIGNGPGGNEAASSIRKYRNISVSMFSEEPYPQYSPCFLHDFISGSLDRKLLFLKNEQDYAANAINTFFGKCVYEIDADKKCVIYEEGKEYYDKLIIAMGNRPIVPKVDGLNLKGVFTFKTMKDAESIAAYKSNTVVVVGAGPIGVEMCIALKRRGLDVYLIEKEGWILPKILEERLANRVEKEIESKGIVVSAGEEIVKILGKDKVKAIVLRGNKIIDCDIVIFAMGMRPKTDIARNAGLNLGNLGGVITDEKMMTSIPDIYACGDCIESKDTLTNKNVLNALWPNAVIGGKVAGLNAIGISRKYSPPLNLNCIQINDVTAISLGYSDCSLRGLDGKDVIEGSTPKGEYRIILLNGNLVGMQIVAKNNNLILLFNSIYTQKKLSMVKRAFRHDEFTMRNPLYFLLLTTRNFHLMKKIKNGYWGEST
jgi:NADH oxidase (H2O2-forming)